MLVVTALFGLALAQGEAAQVAPAAPPSAALAAPAPSSIVRIAAGTSIEVELLDGVGSKTSHLRDRFKLRLVQPLAVDGVVVVPAGALGEGEVIDAMGSGLNGKQGKLVLAARFLDLNGKRARIRGITMGMGGQGRTNEALALTFVPYVGLAAMFMKGGEIELPAGTRAWVRLAEDVELTVNSPSETKGAIQ